MKSKHISPLLWLALAVATSSQAVQVNFSGGLIESVPCTISGGQLLQLDFGNAVIIRNLNGVNYSKPINYQITCADVGTVHLTLKGTETSFDDAAIQTNVVGLGIRVNRGGVPFTLNTPIVVDPASPPVLEAVPVADPANTPATGVFNATATLMADYQ
ncbi:fimbrial protein [Pseudomonas sp. 8O]|uniref:fimbrial protein n=1 Tax=Pseudomonas sp. 8O TaxID=2653165 RepID=UPI0012F3B054|nr:fimbrial protein [Pseudomonas sp. 8O]VXC36297.1 Pilin (Type 1 fimbria component protein) [Pseudomonas sp. 8O]